MEKIRTSHILYFFILLFPLSNFILPFLIYGNEMNIRIYTDGSFSEILPDQNIIFPDKGTYINEPPQGTVYKIDPKSIYLSIIYTLIFIITTIFIFTFKNKKLNYEINFLKNDKVLYLKLFFFFFIITTLIQYYKLSEVSNFFYNLLILSKIYLIFISCQLLFISRNKYEIIIFILFLIFSFIFIVDLRSKINLPSTYNLIFNFYFLTFIISIFLSFKKKLKLTYIILIGFISILMISIAFLWKENLRSYSYFNWNKLSSKIDVYNVNKPFGNSEVISSVLVAPLARVNKLDQFSYIIEKKDYNEMLLGKSYTPIFSKFIPRQLWKNKPQEVFGNEYARKYKFIPSYDKTTSVGSSTLIESYINFGFWGILLLSIFYGFIYRLINHYIYVLKDKSVYLSFLFIVISLFISITSESNLSSGFGGAIQMFVVALILKSFIKHQ
tara:strand:- start:5216 stop:6538 length:1323 start_codon:yes stop_codon:yes gene_type:complete